MSMPFKENKYNVLEISNEVIIMMFVYLMTCFISTSLLNGKQQWYVGYFVITLVMTLFIINVATWIRVMLDDAKLHLVKRRR